MTVLETLPSIDAWADDIAARLAEVLVQSMAQIGDAIFAGAGGTTWPSTTGPG